MPAGGRAVGCSSRPAEGASGHVRHGAHTPFSSKGDCHRQPSEQDGPDLTEAAGRAAHPRRPARGLTLLMPRRSRCQPSQAGEPPICLRNLPRGGSWSQRGTTYKCTQQEGREGHGGDKVPRKREARGPAWVSPCSELADAWEETDSGAPRCGNPQGLSPWGEDESSRQAPGRSTGPVPPRVSASPVSHPGPRPWANTGSQRPPGSGAAVGGQAGGRAEGREGRASPTAPGSSLPGTSVPSSS